VPTNNITVGIKHVEKKFGVRFCGVDTVCQSNFAYPVFVASFFTAALLEVAQK
jgi:hypothetical protein